MTLAHCHRPRRAGRAALAALLGAALAATAALHSAAFGAASDPGTPSVQSLGVKAGPSPLKTAALSNGGFAFSASEAAMDSDLDHDKDTADLVLQVWEPGDTRATNLGLPLSGQDSDIVGLDGGAFAFAVPEAADGNVDLNGDGDTTDSVVFVWDPQRGAVNLGVAVATVNVCCYTDKYRLAAVLGGDVAFLVPEAGQGHHDRNGDGDAADTVAAVWDHTTGSVTNVAVDATTVDGLSDGSLAVVTSEAGQGRTDLNGDGDTKDDVAEVWHRGGATTDLGLAAHDVVPFGGGRLAVLVPEADQGEKDRNGDGDTADTVVAVWDSAAPGAPRNLAVAQGNTETNVTALEGGRLAVRVLESDQGVDLDGDGDTIDKVVELWDPASQALTNLHLPGTHLVPLAGGGLAFTASTLEVWEPATGAVTSVGDHNNGLAQAMPDGRVAYGVAEFAVHQDLNGDGDTTDNYVLSIWDPATGTATSAGVDGEGVPLSGGAFLIGVSEPSQGFDKNGNGNGDDPGVDLDGDGDATDSVLHLWAGGRVTNLHRAGAPVATLAGDRAAALDSDNTMLIVSMPVPQAPPTTTGPGGDDPAVLPPAPAPGRSGYWMVGRDGAVYAFGDARSFGNAPVGATPAVDLEPTPSGAGYWIVDETGRVFNLGDASRLGDVDRAQLARDEKITSLSTTPSGRGYWVFTTRGRVIVFGDARWLGDMATARLNGPVLDSIPTPSGNGYYMVASDGGIFAFGDAVFRGSMGGRPLNAPVESLVPEADGSGYWLVASDGGIFAFDAPFLGSMGGQRLNGAVTGMVRYGKGYLMVGEDGGIFSFSNRPFAGSLGGRPPAQPIVSVAAFGS
ncbi:MAG: hypothetical protein LC792_01645 [Actinobacteria bacterium]|nr:hypothetical protein [Actinomycetota bacterium]